MVDFMALSLSLLKLRYQKMLGSFITKLYGMRFSHAKSG